MRWWRVFFAKDDKALAGGTHESVKVLGGLGKMRELCFAEGVTQSRMSWIFPYRLVVAYTRTMLGALVLRPNPARIAILGLGGGSQLKWCYRHLPNAHIDVAEINPDVIAVRKKFKIPNDDARLQIICVDALEFLQTRANTYDLILLDCYDAYGIPPALATAQFDGLCRAALRDGGVLAMNLYATNFPASLERLQKTFAGKMAVLQEPAMSNRVVFAWRNLGAAKGGFSAKMAAQGLSGKGFAELEDVFMRIASEANRDYWHKK